MVDFFLSLTFAGLGGMAASMPTGHSRTLAGHFCYMLCLHVSPPFFHVCSPCLRAAQAIVRPFVFLRVVVVGGFGARVGGWGGGGDGVVW